MDFLTCSRPLGRRPRDGATRLRVTATIFAAAAAVLATSAALAAARASDEPTRSSARGEHARPAAQPRLDRSGRRQVGTASVYASTLAGRKMADGTRLDPNDGDVAASKTLPLGTEAKVTNLETGRSTRVTIQDRGPYAKGRILDVSPAAAAKLGITRKDGVAKVEVEPIVLPAEKKDARKD